VRAAVGCAPAVPFRSNAKIASLQRQWFVDFLFIGVIIGFPEREQDCEPPRNPDEFVPGLVPWKGGESERAHP